MIKAYNQDYSYIEHWQVRYDKIKAAKIVKKLLRHFKLDFVRVYFETNKNGRAGCSKIELPKRNIALGMICHEIGHVLAWRKGYRGHTKRSYKYIHRVYRYAVKYIPDLYYVDYTKGNDYY